MDLDPKTISEFFLAPDAGEIVSAFSVLQGPHRAILVAQVQAFAALHAEPAPARPAPEGPRLLAGPDTLLSESLEGRVHERRLRGEGLHQIAKAEGIEFRTVKAILLNAQKAAGKAATTAPAAKPAAKQPRRAKTEAETLNEKVIKLRKEGRTPKQIAGDLDMTQPAVAAVIYRAKQQGVTFPWLRPGPRLNGAATH